VGKGFGHQLVKGGCLECVLRKRKGREGKGRGRKPHSAPKVKQQGSQRVRQSNKHPPSPLPTHTRESVRRERVCVVVPRTTAQCSPLTALMTARRHSLCHCCTISRH
jgi:hypothetical protein